MGICKNTVNIEKKIKIMNKPIKMLENRTLLENFIENCQYILLKRFIEMIVCTSIFTYTFVPQTNLKVISDIQFTIIVAEST